MFPTHSIHLLPQLTLPVWQHQSTSIHYLRRPLPSVRVTVTTRVAHTDVAYDLEPYPPPSTRRRRSESPVVSFPTLYEVNDDAPPPLDIGSFSQRSVSPPQAIAAFNGAPVGSSENRVVHFRDSPLSDLPEDQDGVEGYNMDGEEMRKIPRPTGQNGRQFTLHSVLSPVISERKFKNIQDSVVRWADDLDPSLSFLEQESSTVEHIRDLMLQVYPELGTDFEGAWPVNEFIQTRLNSLKAKERSKRRADLDIAVSAARQGPGPLKRKTRSSDRIALNSSRKLARRT